MSIISVGCEVTFGSSNVDVRPDGTYRVLGGGLGVINSEGHIFPADQKVKDLFSKSSTLLRRAKGGTLKAENKHPSKRPEESKEDFVRRFLDIDNDRVCAVIKHVEVGSVPVDMPGQAGKVYPVWLHIEPMGTYGDALRSDMSSYSNTAFSIRALSKRGKLNGRVSRTLFHIITWDWVNEPGINFANKASWTKEDRMDINIGEFKNLLTQVDTDDLSTEDKDLYKEVYAKIESCEGMECSFFSSW